MIKGCKLCLQPSICGNIPVDCCMIFQEQPSIYLVCLFVFILFMQSYLKVEKKPTPTLKSTEIRHKRIVNFQKIQYNDHKSSSLKDSLTGCSVNKDLIIYCEEFQIAKPFNYSTFSENF